ncbi:MAG: indolepyruvate ferredoxin oxidoreductase family protein [Xanthobacteraceae bacterium]|nr:MAG: indolepyruvate ferredoxin oxidoreductase family protein [Xanthobacteraceae bacterium]
MIDTETASETEPKTEIEPGASPRIGLDHKYTRTSGRIFLSGMQALVRLPMVQIRRDRANGLHTAGLVSGYRGSPLAGLDTQFMAARKYLDRYDIVFQPGVNEELAATAVWGSQQLHLSPGARHDGVIGMWYGKGPGVDRSGDVFKHANAAGSSAHGGVLCIAGDDHGAKSSSMPHQSDHAFISALIPVLHPSSIHEIIEMGLLGIAMSRFSGCWVGFKAIAETVETSGEVDLAAETRQFVIPSDFEMPPGGLNLRWPDDRWSQDARLQNHKPLAALAFARANGVNRLIMDSPGARFGLVASGKAYEDVRQALRELGIDDAVAARIGLRLYKIGMPWPLEPTGIRNFAVGLEEILIVEERREIVENQIKQELFNWRDDVRPRVVGKMDEHDHPFLSLSDELTVPSLVCSIVERLLRFEMDPQIAAHLRERADWFRAREERRRQTVVPIHRSPYFCSGCPHNTSTRVPEGSRALAGIGCHIMAAWMDRRTVTFTQMGGEGVPWMGMAPFTNEPHMFANLGDGTYFHSGLLAIRQAVSSNANITYKILYNDAVAMTGGQHVDGQLSPQQITHQLHQEGVKVIYFLSDHPENYQAGDLAPGTMIRHRDQLDEVMLTLRETPGCTAIVYVQTCAAEKRRRRKRGVLEDPALRVYINPQVCEGCGDCSVQSNCISVEPLETEFGRKRRINQSSCNKDYSCLKGFCPSFVTIEGGRVRQRAPAALPDLAWLPEPAAARDLTEPYNIAVAGVGGTGVLTIGALIGMAAHIEGKASLILDVSGLAQKGGAVLSHVRIGRAPQDVTCSRIVAGEADLLIAADEVVAVDHETIALCRPDRTHGVINSHLIPISDFVRHRDLDFQRRKVTRTLQAAVKQESTFLDLTHIAEALLGDTIATNIMMLGMASQQGHLPVSPAAIEQAIELNAVSVDMNKRAFALGRMAVADPARLAAMMKDEAPAAPTLEDMSLDDIIAHRIGFLTGYQSRKLAARYAHLVDDVRMAAVGTLGQEKGEALARAVAVNYAKLLAVKDEYEVARLFADPAFRRDLAEQFEGPYTVKFHLAPPLLPGKDARGRPRKRAFGPWMMRLFGVLARLRILRGTAFDVFGHTAERRHERQLIADYEADVVRVLAKLGPATAATALALLALPDQIRGYGPVKAEAIAKAAAARRELLARMDEAGAPLQPALAAE